MKKLASKTFLTLFIIFSSFLFTILFIFNYQGYVREKENINNNLMRLNGGGEPFDKEIKKEIDDKPIKIDNIDRNKRFMDAKIYTVIIDDGKISEIISHTEDGTIADDVYSLAEDIIVKNKTTYIGNLYTNRYSYKVMNESLVIIDNIDTNNRLNASLRLSLLYLVAGEIICYVISIILSNWIIKPAIDSFNKQKEFIADASHELKTPLAVIMASSEAYEKDKNQKWLDNIKSESERMNNLVKDLLDLAKIDNDKEINFEIVDLTKITEKAVLTLESLMFEKDIKLDYKLEDNISLNCNSDQINQLLTILLDNAIKHSSKNGNVIVNLSKSNDKIILEIKNKGLPIPKGEEEKIFDRFYRVDKSRNRDDNRYGLGLSIAKSIVLKHKGTIIAYSDNGYTTFRIVFKTFNK